MKDEATKPILLYGATGYTGRLTAELAAKHRCNLTLASRDPNEVSRLADSLSLPWSAFDLKDVDRIVEQIQSYSVVLHLAGPYRDTAPQMREACIKAKVHYVDITGELEVYIDHLNHQAQVKSAGICLLTGAGFDVTPSDCLSAYLKQQLPDADQLSLFFLGGAGMSRGTMTSGLSMIGGGTPIRRGGQLIKKMRPPTAELTINGKPRSFIASAWGDLVTAAYSTGIENITVYFDLKTSLIGSGWLAPVKNWLLGSRLIKKLLLWIIQRSPAGPNQHARESAHQQIIGIVTNPKGQQLAVELTTCEAYTLTAFTALKAAEVLQDQNTLNNPVGVHTPSTLLGADFILQFDRVCRKEIPDLNHNYQ